jgi:hypothetical protein
MQLLERDDVYKLLPNRQLVADTFWCASLTEAPCSGHDQDACPFAFCHVLISLHKRNRAQMLFSSVESRRHRQGQRGGHFTILSSTAARRFPWSLQISSNPATRSRYPRWCRRAPYTLMDCSLCSLSPSEIRLETLIDIIVHVRRTRRRSSVRVLAYAVRFVGSSFDHLSTGAPRRPEATLTGPARGGRRGCFTLLASVKSGR